jgi:hypothetical protein
MATFRPQHGSFSRNLYRSASEQQPMITEPDLNHDENDQMYWLTFIPAKRKELVEKTSISAGQLGDFMASIADLSYCRQWHKIAAQIHLELAVQLDPPCPHTNTDTTHISRMEYGEAVIRELTVCKDCGEEVSNDIAGLASEYEMELEY